MDLTSVSVDASCADSGAHVGVSTATTHSRKPPKQSNGMSLSSRFLVHLPCHTTGRYCGSIHVGRVSAISRRKRRKRSEARRRPSARVANRRLDLALVLEIGERALWCGRSESEGGTEKRVNVIV